MKKRLLFLAFTFLIFNCLSFAQTLAPGAPGKDAQWATAGKQAIGTSASLDSKVWFTLADGALTEVYYPDVTVANVHLLQFVVVNPKTKKVETERDDATHEIKDYFSEYYNYQLKNKDKKRPAFPSSPLLYENPDDLASLRVHQINSAKSGEWKITKDYVTDPKSNTVLINVQFDTKNKDLELYIYYDPSLGNTGMHDTAWNNGEILLSKDGNNFSALMVKANLSEISSGFYQVSDGVEQLRSSGKITNPYSRAENGNVTQIAKINSKGRNQGIFTVALSFGKSEAEVTQTAQNSLKRGFVNPFNEFVKGWSDYVKTLPKVEAKYQAQFNMAAMVLKAQEDKTVRGANVASLTIPWGGGKNANEDVGGGYHLVWARDLYQVFTAYLALGDTAAANRALDFLFNIQQKPDGSFPQNSWLDGRNGWGGLQMDEVGYPLIMAYQLKRFDKATYENHVKKAADFLVKNGPVTPQERWEEKPGYSPSTIAAEIAGLVCAAEIARKNNDETSANLWLKTADDWQSNIEKWTATTNGKFGDGNYYVRLTANGKPDAGEKIELSNSSGAFFENEIVDAGFLELVRLGIKSPDDPLIVKSLKVIDSQIKVNTPNGESFYRYNHDGYGEQPDGRRWNFDGTYSGTGRLWALLTGERGFYEIALCQTTERKILEDFHKSPEKYGGKLPESSSQKILEPLKRAYQRADAMMSFANEGLMMPEQIWDKAETPKNIDKQFVPELKFGEGTGSATPLAWSMATFIRLVASLEQRQGFRRNNYSETPDVVYNRYVLGKKETAKVETSISDANGFYQNLPLQNKTVLTSPSNKKVEISANCYSEWWDRNKEKKLAKSPVIVKCRDNSFLPVFVYSGEGKDIEVVGDFTEWKPQKLYLTRYQPYAPVEGDFLDFSRYFPLDNISSSARVEYKLIVDGKWITDPLNPNKVDNGVGGENSFFTMPDYKPTNWDGDVVKKTDSFLPTAYFSPTEIEINSKVFNETRKVKVYNPVEPGTKNAPNLPVVYLQDGSDYINRAKAINTQYNLVKAGKIKPFIMVFLDPKDRMKEYWANDNYAKYIATEVVPAIDKQYKTIESRDGRAILGASLGGVTSVHTAVKYPEIFGRVGGQSSSFWIDNERVVKELETLDVKRNNFKFYFDVGTLEGADDDKKAVAILRGKGFDVTYREGETGHNWTSWRDRLADAFIALWR